MSEETRSTNSEREIKTEKEVKVRKAQFKDERGKWIDMPMVDYRITPEVTAFEAARQQKMVTRVIEPDGKGGIVVIKMFRNQKRRS
jgi:hypothetical protein